MSAEISKFSPLVSVLIRSMDRTSLPEALASVAAQTYRFIEIVLVNAKGDGHKAVGQLCGSFPIRFVQSPGALSRSEAANFGLDQARGEYVIFLDDDDLIDVGHIESLVNAVRESANCKAAFSGTRITDSLGVTLGVFDQAFSSAQLLVGNFLPIHAVLFSRDLLAAGCRFDATLETYEDWDFWLQVSRFTSFAKTGNVSAVYRSFLGDSGMSHAEHRPLQRQRRSVVWQKWWPAWTVEHLNLLAFDLEKAQEAKQKENAELRSSFSLEIHKNSQLHYDVAELQQSLNQQVQQVSSFGQTIADLNVSLVEVRASLAEREGALINRDIQISLLNASIQEILSSNSWKLSAPIRYMGRGVGLSRRKIKAAGFLAQSTWLFLRRDSFSKQMRSAYRLVRDEGWSGVKQRLNQKATGSSGINERTSTKKLEPSQTSRLERHNYKQLTSISVEKYDYFFFDVFDTAVMRLLEKPVDLFKYIGFVNNSAGFEKRRISQESKTREENSTRKDIKLAEIYGIFKGAELEHEIEAELKFCVAHPEVFAFYADLVSKGKKIYFVSDMYLDKETVSEILHKNGFDRYEEIFVSSEDDFVKGDGSRFAWLKSVIPDSIGTAIHIGDNHVSDWIQPRRHGYDAFHYMESIEFYRYDSFLFSKAPCLIAQDSLGISFVLGMFRYWKSGFLDKKPGYWKQFGFFYGGALVSAFCGFVNNTVLNAKLPASRVFFLARDGDIMSQVYRLLYPEYDAVYLLASRRCMSFPSLSTLNPGDDEDALKLFTTPIGISCANDLMERLGYDDLHELRNALNALEARGLIGSESEILRCIIGNKGSVLSKANAERDMLLRYLESMKFFEETDIVIADVGWGGTIQNALVKLLKQAGREHHNLHGIYLGVGDHVAHADLKTGFLFEGDRSRFAEFLNLIELITSSPKEGVVRISEIGDEYVSIGPRKNVEELNRQSIAVEIQAGIMEFAKIIKDKGIHDLSFFQPNDFEVIFGSLQEYSSEEDVEYLSSVKHAMTLGSHFGDQVLNKKG